MTCSNCELCKHREIVDIVNSHEYCKKGHCVICQSESNKNCDDFEMAEIYICNTNIVKLVKDKNVEYLFNDNLNELFNILPEDENIKCYVEFKKDQKYPIKSISDNIVKLYNEVDSIIEIDKAIFEKYFSKFSNEKEIMTEKEFLSQYNPDLYKKPSVTTDILLFTVDSIDVNNRKKNPKKCLKILLVKRKDFPYKNCWALPGGFNQVNEGLINSAYRELKEETNVSNNVYLEQLYTFGDDINRDPRMRVISTAYMALTPKDNIKETLAGDDAVDAAWFEVIISNIKYNHKKLEKTYNIELKNDALERTILYTVSIRYYLDSTSKTLKTHQLIMPIYANNKYKLAFDHIDIINMALDRLKNKVEYTPIAFNLLNDEFTLDELQQIYEILLQKKLTKQNFRKKMMPMLIETERISSGRDNRPAKYYKYNPYWELKMKEE